ncbi:uncharacterized protein LOC117113716 [Anneissia japonica]|uniref:uncharacterized protein LOC117113716 n=1 Tax=Anneissia japonica TaxID=1529436 RepID=UPI0014257B65|nr:uncharacterized protein LOC117113716 [Anneissia japonica]
MYNKLRTGVCAVFFSVFFFVASSLLFFASASVSNFCEPFTDSSVFEKVFDNPEYWKDGITPVEEILQYNNFSTAKSIIQACDMNEDVFTAINMKITNDLYPDINTFKYFNTTSIISTAVHKSIEHILTQDANVLLPDELPHQRPSTFSMMSFVQEVSSELKSLPLMDYARTLKLDADILMTSGNENLTTKLRAVSNTLKDLHLQKLQPTLMLSEQLVQEIEQLEAHVDVVGDSTGTLYENMDKILNYMADGAMPAFNQSLGSYTKRVTSYPRDYTSFTRSKMENDVGYCKPISEVYHSIVAAPCVYCHGALNVFMLSIAALSLLSVAVITFSFSLEKYLKRSPSSSSAASEKDNEDIVMKSHRVLKENNCSVPKENNYASADAWSWTNSVIDSEDDPADAQPTYTNFNPADFQGTWDSGVVSTCSTTNNPSP